MLFKKKRDAWEEALPKTEDLHEAVLEALISLCEDGMIYEDAFVLEDEEVYVYADILSMKNNVVQIIFQVHHAWLDEPMLEAVAAAGNDSDEAVFKACKQFYEQVLTTFLSALHQQPPKQIFTVATQEPHRFGVYCSKIVGIGKQEDTKLADLWTVLQEELPKRLGNCRVYGVKIFASRQKEHVECEVRINGSEAVDLSRRLLPLISNWACSGKVYTQRQWLFFVQEEATYSESEITSKDIMTHTQEAICGLEACEGKEAYQQLRRKFIKSCKDESLAYEILSFIPELYCEYAYPQVMFGEKLFLVQKAQKTRELYQSQLQSFGIVKKCVWEHLQEGADEQAKQRVLAYSVNAKAIQKALQEGCTEADLAVSGIGYIGCLGYILR